MPYREAGEDPRVDVIRRKHTAAELAAVKGVVRQFENELEQATRDVADASFELDRASRGRRGWFERGPDVAEIERARAHLQGARFAREIAVVAVEVALGRERKLADLIDLTRDEAVVHDPVVDARAIALSVRAATELGREVRKVMRETSELVTQAHREEMVLALTGEGNGRVALPLADRAVTIARCRIELFRASLVALGSPWLQADWIESIVVALGEVVASLVAAGTGPGQAWKEHVSRAKSQLDGVVAKLEQS